MVSEKKHSQRRHWSQLDTNDQVRFWQDVDDGSISSFLTSPGKKKTRRRRGEHSTKPKCENPSWFRAAHYKKLGGQLGRVYNLLVKSDPDTGKTQLRKHMSRHPLYVKERQRAGRKNAFKPEKQRMIDSIWPLLVSFCDAAHHGVGMCTSRLARELSPKDKMGNVIPGTEVTVSRMSNLLAEQVRYGVLAFSSEKEWDRETRTWLPKYVWITELGFSMLGADPVKLRHEQEKRLRLSAEREQLIKLGLMHEGEDISPAHARRRWAENCTLAALKFRRKKGAERKRANRLARLPRDSQVYEMSKFILKTMPPDEAYWCTSERLEQLAIQRLYQLKLFESSPS